jgi:hypothetical protein
LKEILDKYPKSIEVKVNLKKDEFLGTSQSPFDLDDKEVAESMSCTTDYPLQFEACMTLFSLYSCYS